MKCGLEKSMARLVELLPPGSYSDRVVGSFGGLGSFDSGVFPFVGGDP